MVAVIVELSKMLDVCGVKLCVLLFVYILYVGFIDLYHINFGSPSDTHKLVLLLLRNGYYITGSNLAGLTVMIYCLRQKKERSAVSLGTLIINRMWSNFKWYLNVR